MGKQPIDADPTVTKPKRKLQRTDTPWGRIKREWEAGTSTTTLSLRYGLTYDTVWRRSKREGWIRREEENTPKPASQQASQPVQSAVKERLGRHFVGVLDQVETLQQAIREHSSRRLEVEEIKSLSNSLDTVDRIARRTFGLDGPGGGSPGSLLATVAPAVLCPVIDAEPVPAQVLPAEPGR